MFRVWQDDKDALARVSVVSCSGVIYDELRQQLYIYIYLSQATDPDHCFCTAAASMAH